jgi:hypothetical protein
MAALTSANVRLIASWTEGSVTGKRRKVRRVEVFGGTWGGDTNTMPASAFGLQVIEEATPGIYGGHAYVAAPISAGTRLNLFDSTGASSAVGDVALDTTPSGMYITVKGY